MDYYRCFICYSEKLNTENQSNQNYNLQEVISNCSNYLGKDILSINPNVTYIYSPFCENCRKAVEQLLDLHRQFEQINLQIQRLVAHVRGTATTQRKKHELFQNASNIPLFQSNILRASQSTLSNTGSQDERKPAVVTSENVNNDYQTPFIDDHNLLRNDATFFQTNHPPKNKEFLVENSVLHKTKKQKKIAPEKRDANSDNQKNGKTISSSLMLTKRGSAFECPTCHKKFNRMDILERHECGNQTFECETCGKSFFSEGSLKLHRGIHTGEKRHKCETCGKCFNLPHHLRLHIRTHTGEKPYECDVCHQRFSDSKTLKNHKRRHLDVNVRRQFKCDICSKSYTLSNSLRDHIRLHTGDKVKKCDICGKLFGTTAALEKHSLKHTKEKSFKCSVCFKDFVSKYTLQTHMLIHSEEKPFKCDACGKSYCTPQGLKVHGITNHGDGTRIKIEKQKCIVCEQSFAKGQLLLRHQSKCHTVMTFTLTKCDKCNTEFENELAFNNHLRILLKKSKRYRDFDCDLCRAENSSHCQLLCHFQEKHSDAQLPFKCRGCGLRFLRRPEIFLHKEQAGCTVTKRSVSRNGKRGRNATKQRKTKIAGSDCTSDTEVTDDDTKPNVETVDECNVSTLLRRSTRLKHNVRQRVGRHLPNANSEVSATESDCADLDNVMKIKVECDEIKEEPNNSDSSCSM